MAIPLFNPQSHYSLVIKDHSIRFLELRSNLPNGVRRHEEVQLPEGTIENGTIINKQQLEDTLKKCIKHWKIKNKKLFIIVPDTFTVVRKLDIPGHINEHEIRSHLFMEIGQSIHLPFDNPVFDIYILGQKEEATEILLFAAPEDTVKQYVDVLEDCGTKPVAAEFSSLSLYRLLEKLDLTINQSAMIIQFDVDGINVSIFQRHLPLFIRQISSETEENENMGYDYSEVYSEIERMMNFYQFSLHNGEESVQRIVLTGDHPDIQSFYVGMANILTVPVYPLFNEQIKDNFNQLIPRKFQVNVGLALKEVPSK